MKKMFSAGSLGSLAVIVMTLACPFVIFGQTVEFFMNNGQELLQRGAYSQAANAFKEALSREPDYFEAQYNLGLTYVQWGNYPSGVVELKKALNMKPTSSIVWSSLAVAYDNQNNAVGAMDALAHAVNYDPSNVTARMNLAAMFANAKKMPEAITQYRELVKMDGGNVEAILNLSRCLVYINQLGEAKGYLKQAIAAEPDKGDAHSELGDIYLKNEHDTDAAIVEYQAAIMVEQNNATYYQQLAWALENKGRKQEAVETWKKALLYLDDPMQKEDVQTRIDRLEKGAELSGAAGVSTPHEPTMTRSQTEDLEREVRPDSSKEAPRLKTTQVDVSSDLQQLSDDTSSMDLTKELNKLSGAVKSTPAK